jgi:hypothetical protein
MAGKQLQSTCGSPDVRSAPKRVVSVDMTAPRKLPPIQLRYPPLR